ncbi:MAG TPA: alcohol dehydrogenase catalytic domain-containing protein [Bacteroidales bacterium]|nr:alcohol dehydrogenase catalytic domain-containing protein [Bacteroidales bacterium]
MKAIFLDKPDGLLIVKEVRTPVPGPGEVLVKMKAAPVNPSDLARIKRSDNNLETFIPGLEGSGDVVAAGKGFLPRLWMGKRVACSAEYATSGTWSEYMVTKAGKCFPLNAKVDYDQGSMMLVNPLTAIGFIEIVRAQRHRAIINNAAASALGRMVELLGKKHNIPVINIVRSNKHLERLTGSGSKYVLDSSAPSFIDDLGKLSHDLNATILFDSTCSRQIEKMTGVIPYGSSVIIYGNLTGEENIMINPRILIDKDIRISGFYVGARTKENSLFKNIMNLREVSRLMRSEMKVSIQGRFPPDRAQEAIDTYLANMSAGKVLIVND